MLRSTSEQGRLYLTADLRPTEAHAKQMSPQAGVGLFAGQFSRFPPVEDVVASLDRIASRTIAA